MVRSNGWIEELTPEEGIGLVREFSARWDDGGSLIEEYKVGVWPGTAARPLSQLWSANIPDEGGCFDDAREQVGFTPLEAACRAIVASKFGEEVSDDLC